MVKMKKKLFFLICCVSIFACTFKSPPPEINLSLYQKKILFKKVSRQFIASRDQLINALNYQIDFLIKQNPNKIVLNRGTLTCTYGDLLYTALSLMDNIDLLWENITEFSRLFNVYVLSTDTLLTGYYEPWLEANYIKTEEYKYPIYGLPDDLKVVDLGKFHPRFKGQRLYYRILGDKIEPYFSREEIDNGALEGRGLEIAWVKDKVKLFFLHIQGSGRLIFPDGTVKHVLFAGKNGRQYVSLGRVLVKKGLLKAEKVNLKTIFHTLEMHPELVDDLMWANPSYVFFKLADKGPFGCISQPLTPWVSVASDNSFLPWGSIVIGEGELPLQTDVSQKFASIFLAQDTGGAIVKDHLDLFCGSGDKAEFIAGHLKNRIKLYLILRKNE